MSELADRYRELRDRLGPDHPDTQAAFDARLEEVLGEEEAEGLAGWWWCSFADPARPKGQQFLGAAIAHGAGMMHAIRQLRALGINPGGEVQAHRLPFPAGFDMAAAGIDPGLLRDTREAAEAFAAELHRVWVDAGLDPR